MGIELQSTTTREYLQLLDDIQRTRPYGYRFKEKWVNHPYEGSPVINPDGSIDEEYIKRQDKDGRSYLNVVNKHFDQKNELYRFDKVIVDERQLTTEPKDIMDMLLRAPEVRGVAEYYLKQDGGFFAVKPGREGKPVVKTPLGAEIPDELKESEEMLVKALPKVKMYERRTNLKLDKKGWLWRWHENRRNVAEAGGVITYTIELLSHKGEWLSDAEILSHFIYNNPDFETVASELLRRAYEYLPSEEGLAVVSVSAALYFAPRLVTSLKRRSGKKKSLDVNESNILEILMNEQ